jgi:hypothetical protein
LQLERRMSTPTSTKSSRPIRPSQSQLACHKKRVDQSPHLRTPNPGFNPRLTLPFILQMQGVNPGLNPDFGVLRCGPRFQSKLKWKLLSPVLESLVAQPIGLTHVG